jgi:signal transduction histidine kinase
LAGSCFYVLVNILLQYQEKSELLERQAAIIGQAVRQDLLSGNQIAVYEQCRSIFSENAVDGIILKRGDRVLCNENKKGKSVFSLTKVINVGFDSYKRPEGDNLAGSVELRISANSIFYSFILSLLFLLSLLAGFFILLRRAQRHLSLNVIVPIQQLTSLMENTYSVENMDNFQRPLEVPLTELTKLLDSYNGLTKRALDAERNLIEQTRISASVEIAKQVAHDIRSPLSALNIVSSVLFELPEEKRRVVTNSISRINDIANDLLKQKIEIQSLNVSGPTVTSLDASEMIQVSSLVDNLVAEKRLQYQDHELMQIEADYIGTLDVVTKTDGKVLARVLSNCINNSVEALSQRFGKIIVAVRATGSQVIISIKDNGKGIPADILEKLGRQGVSYGKGGTTSGSGLGVYHAKRTVEALGGSFTIHSVLGRGTDVSIKLPRVTTEG